MQAPDFTHLMLCCLCDLGLFWILKLLSQQKNSWDLVMSYRKSQLFLENPSCPYFICLNVNITRQFFTFLHFQPKFWILRLPQEPFTACNTKYDKTGFRRMLISSLVLNKKKMPSIQRQRTHPHSNALHLLRSRSSDFNRYMILFWLYSIPVIIFLV